MFILIIISSISKSNSGSILLMHNQVCLMMMKMMFIDLRAIRTRRITRKRDITRNRIGTLRLIGALEAKREPISSSRDLITSSTRAQQIVTLRVLIQHGQLASMIVLHFETARTLLRLLLLILLIAISSAEEYQTDKRQNRAGYNQRREQCDQNEIVRISKRT